jgi:Fe-Mn family superoxide dismutase
MMNTLRTFSSGKSELPKGKFSDAVSIIFHSFDEFKKQFEDAGKSVSGVGWVWLCLDDKNNLFICSTKSEVNPLKDLAEKNGLPLLTMNAGEHPYYFHNSENNTGRGAFWNVVNWDEIADRYENALGSTVVRQKDIWPLKSLGRFE